MLFTAVLRVAVESFSANNADVVKDRVCIKVKDEKGRGGDEGGREKGGDKPQETVAEPQPIWGMLYADDASIVSRWRNSLAKMMAKFRCSVWFCSD